MWRNRKGWGVQGVSGSNKQERGVCGGIGKDGACKESPCALGRVTPKIRAKGRNTAATHCDRWWCTWNTVLMSHLEHCAN